MSQGPSLLLLLALLPALGAPATGWAGPRPVTFDVTVEPGVVAPGGEARVTLKLKLADGVKLNRYPKVQLKVPAQEGLVLAAEGSLGSDKPPSVEDMEAGKNYFKELDPLELTLRVDPSAGSGTRSVDGKLRVNYCILASGLCKPESLPVQIPLTVR